MQLSTTPNPLFQPLRLGPTPPPAAGAAGASAPHGVQHPHPELDPVVDQQARFRLDGDGPLATRTIVPVSAGARQLLGESARVPEAVRGVLQLVERVAGGPQQSAKLRVNGVAFSDSPLGHGANSFRAHMDDDATYQGNLARLSKRAQAKEVIRMGNETVQEAQNTDANVIAGWLNLGPLTSRVLLSEAGISFQPRDPATVDREGAHTVRVLRHEAQHLADNTRPNLPGRGGLALREALAEANSRSLEQLRPTRTLLGLDGTVSDESLAASIFALDPYAAPQRLLAGALQLSGIDPQGDQARQLLRRGSDEVAETIVTRLAAATNSPVEATRQTLGQTFAEALQAGH